MPIQAISTPPGYNNRMIPANAGMAPNVVAFPGRAPMPTAPTIIPVYPTMGWPMVWPGYYPPVMSAPPARTTVANQNEAVPPQSRQARQTASATMTPVEEKMLNLIRTFSDQYPELQDNKLVLDLLDALQEVADDPANASLILQERVMPLLTMNRDAITNFVVDHLMDERLRQKLAGSGWIGRQLNKYADKIILKLVPFPMRPMVEGILERIREPQDAAVA